MATKATSSLSMGVIFFGDKRAEFFDQIWDGMMTYKVGLPSETKLIRKVSDFSAQSQIEMIDQLEKEGIQGLIIAPYNDPLVAKRLKELHKKGIPVVCVNSDIPNSDRICYVGPDAYQSGVVAADILRILAQDKGEVGIITGSRNIIGHEERVRGFVDSIKRSHSNMTIESIQECKDDDYRCYEMVQKVMRDHPFISSFFFATSGGIYGGCKGLYQMTTRKTFNVVTFDLLDPTKEFLKKGVVSASIYQEPLTQGILSLQVLADKLLEHKDPKSDVIHTNLSIKTRGCI
ncbi:MAG: substrate-binding domain-containing protein [Lachnospiraceae bacterium]|nr:substrate-binding domain-containing protein [Lachnospiraceae bacterium]